jgi:hypothetical protein
MRIFIQPPYVCESSEQIALRAYEVPHNSNIITACPAGIVDDKAVVLVDVLEVAEALAALESAGLRAIADWLT